MPNHRKTTMYNRPHWSYSAISQYLACPLRYYFQRVLGLPQPTVSSSLVLGSSVHRVLAEYHRTVQNDERTKIEVLHQSFVQAWEQRENETRIAYSGGDTRENGIAQGIALFDIYLKEPPPQRIIGIEQEMIAPVHNSQGEYLETPLVAITDLIIEGNEELTVHEFKTSGRAYSEMQVDTSLQPSFYVNAVQEVYGHPATVEYTILVKTKTPRVQRLPTIRTDDDLGRLGDIIQNVERGVQASIFYPIESPLNCSGCPFRKPCREWGRPGIDRESVALGTPAEAISC